jgi:hypothetical protein
VYRELRKMHGRDLWLHPEICPAHAAADGGRWAEYTTTQGGPLVERRNLRVRLAYDVTENGNAYGDDVSRVTGVYLPSTGRDSLIFTRTKKAEMFLDELVLRFFAFKHFDGDFKKTIPIFLSDFMRGVSKGDIAFDLDAEKDSFVELIDFLIANHGNKIFRPKGPFALHLFDSVSYALPKVFGRVQGNEKRIMSAIEMLLNDEQYQEVSVQAFSTNRIRLRMDRALEIFKSA